MNLIKNYSFLVFFIISLFLVNCSENELPPPNIIWLISEDNSPFLGCYGDTTATTPNLDKFAENSLKFLNSFSNAPVCAPSRSTLITGMYATSLGTQHMRSENPTPNFVRFFPYYLRQAGYFTSNRVKKDYNTIDQDSVWDVTDWWDWDDALIGKKNDQPFFLMFNTWMSHEGKIHPNSDNWNYFKGTMSENGVDSSVYKKWWEDAEHDPSKMKIPPYHPETDEMRKDWVKYYDCVELMDREIGVMLSKIEKDSLFENTIIFYFSDHGGVLGRSKRFVFESGLRVPMLLHIPEKYKDLIDYEMGSETDQIVSFVDLAPTVLSLANIEIPPNYEGKAFAGYFREDESEYAFGFRGRMDERYDMARTVRNKRFRYIRNYMPHRIYGGKINYLWKAESMQSWEEEFKRENLDENQSAFWRTKEVEELYDIVNDPHNINNLANDPDFQEELSALRKILQNHLISSKDLGVFPEAEMVKRYNGKSPYEIVREQNFPYSLCLETANIATEGKAEYFDTLVKRLGDNEPVVRYWSAIGLAILKIKSDEAKDKLLKLTSDTSNSVRIAAAEALYHYGEIEMAVNTLTGIIQLPKFGKCESLKNTELYANQFAIANALNVIDALNIDTPKIREIISAIAESERASKRDYDKRIAQNILGRLD